MPRRPKGSPITHTPSKHRYKDGDYTVWKDERGKIHKRKTGVRNYTDRTAPHGNGDRRRKKYANTTDGRQVSHRR